jgi:antagonist of KipI
MFTTVQDLGRFGHASQGVTTSGAMDLLSARIANRLVGNADNAAVLEMTLVGCVMQFAAEAVIAIAGGIADMQLTRDGTTTCIIANRPTGVACKDTLAIGRIHQGCRTYLAIGGGIDVPSVLGSRSTNLLGKFGGHAGRPLKAGDVLPFTIDVNTAPCTADFGTLDALLDHHRTSRTLRAIAGPQHNDFADSQSFWNATHRISNRSDRMGLRLEGTQIAPPFAGRMPSQATPHGAVQVPPEGHPIILGADHPTTGGYPVIASIASVDLPILGQLRPGDEIRFERITHDDAIHLLINNIRSIDRIVPPSLNAAGDRIA